MPGKETSKAVSKAQQRFMAICLHDPKHARGSCPSPSVAREFAETKHKGLPTRVTTKEAMKRGAHKQ